MKLFENLRFTLTSIELYRDHASGLRFGNEPSPLLRSGLDVTLPGVPNPKYPPAGPLAALGSEQPGPCAKLHTSGGLASCWVSRCSPREPTKPTVRIRPRESSRWMFRLYCITYGVEFA